MIEAGLVGEAAEVHARVVEMGRVRAALNRAEAKWLVRAAELRLHLLVGAGSFGEYVERYGAHDSHTARERARVGERLAVLPRMREAVERGEIRSSVSPRRVTAVL